MRRNQNSHARFGRVAIACGLAGLLALSAIGAAAATGSTGDARRAKTKTVYIKVRRSGLPHFVAPNTIRNGDTLRIVNKTNARAIGPHTFSMVARKVIPRTKPERKKCFTPHHICFYDRDLARGDRAELAADEEPGECRARRLEHGGQPEAQQATPGSPARSGTQPLSRRSTSTRPRARRGSPSSARSMPWMHDSIKVLP